MPKLDPHHLTLVLGEVPLLELQRLRYLDSFHINHRPPVECNQRGCEVVVYTTVYGVEIEIYDIKPEFGTNIFLRNCEDEKSLKYLCLEMDSTILISF